MSISNTMLSEDSRVQQRLDKMVEFERCALNVGAINETECHRMPEDETKWSLKHMDRLYRLWLAGARYGQSQLNCFGDFNRGNECKTPTGVV